MKFAKFVLVATAAFIIGVVSNMHFTEKHAKNCNKCEECCSVCKCEGKCTKEKCADGCICAKCECCHCKTTVEKK